MKKLIVFLLFIGVIHTANSQNSILSVNYHIAIPSLEFSDFMEDNSYKGWSVDYRVVLEDRFLVGGQLGYHIFNKRYPRDTYTIDNGAINAVQWRYAHVVPILAVGAYELFDYDTKLNVAVGLGMGPYYIREEVWVGVYEFVYTHWAFGLAPEVILRYDFNETMGIQFAPRYQAVFNGEQANLKEEKKHMGIWDFRFGLYFSY